MSTPPQNFNDRELAGAFERLAVAYDVPDDAAARIGARRRSLRRRRHLVSGLGVAAATVLVIGGTAVAASLGTTSSTPVTPTPLASEEAPAEPAPGRQDCATEVVPPTLPRQLGAAESAPALPTSRPRGCASEVERPVAPTPPKQNRRPRCSVDADLGALTDRDVDLRQALRSLAALSEHLKQRRAEQPNPKRRDAELRSLLQDRRSEARELRALIGRSC